MSDSTIILALALFVAAKYAAKYYLLFGLIFFVVVGGVARSKNRSFVGWFLLSIVITPLFALIALVAVPRKLSARELRGSGFDGSAIRITREY
jgi:hypothetical protein